MGVIVTKWNERQVGRVDVGRQDEHPAGEKAVRSECEGSGWSRELLRRR